MNLKTLQDTPPWDWPKDAAERFQKTLLDPAAKESDRIVAAELAGNMIAINDELADALLAVVGNPADPVHLRAKAAISLGPVLEQGNLTEFDDPEEVPITEETFDRIQATFEKLYSDARIPKEVRRRILEASVRDPEDWHNEAIQAAYASGDRDWMLTAVFAMGYVRGFDAQILEALKSKDAEIHFEAVEAAGTWELDGAYSHVVALVNDPRTPKPLIFAAIEAVANIRPTEARHVLEGRLDSGDEEIKEVAEEALMMAEGRDDWADEEEEELNPGGEWIN